jgi:prophage antirepressor-like protein
MDLITKNFNDFQVRILLIDNKEWFIAKDIAEILEYKKTANAIKVHCKKAIEWKDFNKVTDSMTFKLHPQTKLILEPDVWRLIIKSEMPEAEKIEEWIFEEVLPQIRKTGSYSLSETPDLDKLKKRVELIHFATNLVIDYKKSFFEIGITRQEELGITVNRAVAKDSTVDFLEIAKKKDFPQLKNILQLRNFVKLFGMEIFLKKQKKLFQQKTVKNLDLKI